MLCSAYGIQMPAARRVPGAQAVPDQTEAALAQQALWTASLCISLLTRPDWSDGDQILHSHIGYGDGDASVHMLRELLLILAQTAVPLFRFEAGIHGSATETCCAPRDISCACHCSTA